MKRREFLRSLSMTSLAGLIGYSEARAKKAGSAAAGSQGSVLFHDVTAQAGLHFTHCSGSRNRLLPEDMGSGLAWGDYDNDGFPDLYVVNQPSQFGSSRKDGPGNRLYHNNGNGTFTDVTESAHLELHHFGMGAFGATMTMTVTSISS